jgi:hypothetical protein
MTNSEESILTPAVRELLAAPRIARLCTVGKDGYPHIVPMHFACVEEELIFGTDRDEAKVRNAQRNPKAAAVIGGNPDSDYAGYMIQVDLKVDTNPDPSLTRKLLLRYISEDEVDVHLADWESSGSVLLRLTPRKVIRVW